MNSPLVLWIIVTLFPLSSVSSIHPHLLAPGDYSHITGIATFLPNQTTVVVPVPTIPDAIFEGVEQFTATLSGPSEGVQLEDSVATVDIIEEDCTSLCLSETKHLM